MCWASQPRITPVVGPELVFIKFFLLIFFTIFFLTCGPGRDAQAPGHGPQQTGDAGDALVSVALTCRLDDGRSGIGKNIS